MKKLRVIDYSKVNLDPNKDYIKHVDDTKAIEVPKMLLKTFRKIQNLSDGLNHTMVDNLAFAINNRGLQNIDEAIEVWRKSGYRLYQYPPCNANRVLDKFITVNFHQARLSTLTSKEITRLIHFLAQVPHGYDVTNLLCPHIEFQPVIT